MSIPKIPASTAKLFGGKRRRRQVVLENSSAVSELDKTVQAATVEVEKVSIPAAAVVPPSSGVKVMRRRG